MTASASGSSRALLDDTIAYICLSGYFDEPAALPDKEVSAAVAMQCWSRLEGQRAVACWRHRGWRQLWVRFCK